MIQKVSFLYKKTHFCCKKLCIFVKIHVFQHKSVVKGDLSKKMCFFCRISGFFTTKSVVYDTKSFIFVQKTTLLLQKVVYICKNTCFST